MKLGMWTFSLRENTFLQFDKKSFPNTEMIQSCSYIMVLFIYIIFNMIWHGPLLLWTHNNKEM